MPASDPEHGHADAIVTAAHPASTRTVGALAEAGDAVGIQQRRDRRRQLPEAALSGRVARVNQPLQLALHLLRRVAGSPHMVEPLLEPPDDAAGQLQRAAAAQEPVVGV